VGRLFWKFLAFFWLAQLTSVIGVGVMVWLKSEIPAPGAAVVDTSPPATFHVAAAAATLRYGGVDALRGLLEESRRAPGPPVFAVDEKQAELLGRALSSEAIERVGSLAAAAENRSGVEQVNAADGHRYLLFVPPHARPAPPGGNAESGPPPKPGGGDREFSPRRRSPLPPLMPLAAGALASLVFATLLAWYVARPIRSLRSAFEAAADGRLEQRLAPAMGGRRDELADLGRDFDRMALRLKNLMDGQRRLLHDVSHELRSPLARLQAAIGLARQQPERAEDFLARIERESARMDTLVSELLTLSRLEAGMTGKLDDVVEITDLLDSVVEDARFEAEARACRVEFTVHEDALVQGNAELLHRALENIVRNALKYSPQGACVEIDVTTASTPGQVRIRVLDEGPGVAEAELQSIFAPFFRSSATNSFDGHGLGLAISQRVVEAHRGSIQAVNRPAGGLNVSVLLPLAKA
jgi:two-component system, OmpR family, sensor kinase